MFNETKNNDSESINETMPIHTMKEDLENEKNPHPENKNIASELEAPKKTENRTTPEKTSPFLSSQSWNEQRKEDKKEEAHLETEIKTHKAMGKAVVIGTIIFIILVLAAGGYYYWAVKINGSLKEASLPEISAEQIPTPIETSPDIIADKPNYLSLDIDNSNSAAIKEEIKTYAAKAAKLNTISPIEFIITDKQNNPVSFQKFSQAMEITLPENIISIIGTDFSLYIYSDNNQARIGLSLPVSDESTLKTTLLQEEPNLPKELEPIFLAESYALTDIYNFNASIYDNLSIPVRYANITSPEDLSVDYAIFNNQLFIGTTKMTLRAILDYFNQQSPAIGE